MGTGSARPAPEIDFLKLAAAGTSALAACIGPGRAVTALAATIGSGGILLAVLVARASHRPPAAGPLGEGR